MRITLTVDTGNAAMLTLSDVRYAVGASMARAVEFYGGDTEPYAGQGGWIMDANGNRVGRWGVEPWQMSDGDALDGATR